MTTVMCGVTFKARGEPVVDLFEPGLSTDWIQRSPTLGRDVVVQVAEGCTRGSHVAITPANAFKTVRTVSATDHLPVVVVLEPLRAVPATLIAYQKGRKVGALKLDIPTADVAGPAG